METNYPYAIKNQRGESKITLVGGYFAFDGGFHAREGPNILVPYMEANYPFAIKNQ